MTQIDEFESLFKSASKPVFQLEPITLHKILVVVDRPLAELQPFAESLQAFLQVLNSVEDPIEIHWVDGDEFDSVSELLAGIKAVAPDLICSYRNLKIPAKEYPYSLGVYIDVISQATSIPILLLPRPEHLGETGSELLPPTKVMAVTDHLAGDAHLVTFACRFTPAEGTLVLAHVEDQMTFERYIATIGKIPDLDTDVARQTIMDQLLKEPGDYIASCRTGIEMAGLPIQVESTITVGNHLSDYRNLIRDGQVGLLVLNTKDEDQLAMHGLAYPLSVELREIPLLLI